VIETLWIAFAILIVLDFVLAAVRVSVLNSRLPFLMTLRDEHSGGVERTLRLLEKPRLRASLRLALVVVHFLLLGVAIWLFVQLVGSIPNLEVAFALLATAAVLILVGEFTLEGAILPRAELWAVRFSGLAQAIDILLSPVSSLLTLLLGSPAMLQNRLSPVTEDELKSWVEEGQSAGSMEQDERRMIYSIFHFGDTLAREIMIPRIDILALEANTSLEDAILALNQSGHSRVPV
jgi:putative hemolysin